MKSGAEYKKTMIVTQKQTAKEMGSGDLEVFATPSMIALMEGCAAEGIAPALEDGKTTVGTMINVQHLAATPVGMQVECRAVLTEIDGRRISFDIEVYDEVGLIGKGVHERFIICAESFMKKTYQKLEK